MSDLAELRKSIAATRSVLKAAMRANRAALEFVSDLDDRLEALQNAQPNGGTAYGNRSHEGRAAAGRH